MEKVKLDDKLWKKTFEAAIRFTGDESLRVPIVTGVARVPVPLSRKEAKELRKKFDAIHRHRLHKFDEAVFYWLVERDDEEQDAVIFRLFQLGELLDPEKIYDRLYDWYRRDGMGYAQPKEAKKMSDDILDRWTQYLHINRNLLDDPEMFAEDYIH